MKDEGGGGGELCCECCVFWGKRFLNVRESEVGNKLVKCGAFLAASMRLRGLQKANHNKTSKLVWMNGGAKRAQEVRITPFQPHQKHIQMLSYLRQVHYSVRKKKKKKNNREFD